VAIVTVVTSDRSVAKRSPILGYNHNVRHRGLPFHVQTEDSGVDNPHIYTHLFHGGVIVSSRKLEYDPESAEDVVKALMQAQHKASLRQLKAGAFDAKITAYLGDHPDLERASPRSRVGRDTIESLPPIHDAELAATPRPAAPSAASAPVASAPVVSLPAAAPPVPAAARAAAHVVPSSDASTLPEPSRARRSGEVSNAFRLIKREKTTPADPLAAVFDGRRTMAQGSRGNLSTPPEPRDWNRERANRERLDQERGDPPVERVDDIPTRPVAVPRAPAVVSPVTARPAVVLGAPRSPGRPTGAPSGRATVRGVPPYAAASNRPAGTPRPGVVVSRPAFVVGSPPRGVSPRERAPAPPAPRARREREEGRPSLFGKDLISERSLDEVILAYLSEDMDLNEK